jgi:UDP-glucose 4-epimerase
MHLLVTGGAGFIGSHVVEALLQRGDRVTVLDDHSTGRPEHLQAVRGHRLLGEITGSILDPDAVTTACRDVDAILHFAAAVGVRRILARQVESIRTNAHGTDAILAAAATRGVPVFFASSSEAYGMLDHLPFGEEDGCLLGPASIHRWSYACAKRLDEHLALAYHREGGLRVHIARFFNIAGPRQRPDHGMVLPRFCAAARRGDALLVHGDGQQTRTFLHVADAVTAVLALIACAPASGCIVNVGSTAAVSMLQLAQRVVALAGSTSPITLVPYAEAFPAGQFQDIGHRLPDIGRLRALTGWEPRHDLDAIIRSCLAG